jgi:hypothetical protein
MSVTMRYGIGYSEQSEARYIDMDAALTTSEILKTPIKATIPENLQPSMPWSPWGKNNLLPMEMTVDIETCGILNAIIDGKARFAMCNGIVPVITKRDEKNGQLVIEKYITDNEITDFLDMNNAFFHLYGWMKDLNGYANGVARFGVNRKKDRKIVLFQRDDVTEFRYEKKNAKGIIDNIYLSAEWDKVRGVDDKRVFSVPHLNPNNPFEDLAKKAAESSRTEFAMTFKYPGWNKHYYSVPLWYAAYKWVKIAQGVPEMKAAIFENSMHVKYIVIIHDSYWAKAFPLEWEGYTPEQRLEKKKLVYDDIDKWLVGAKNAYKSIFTEGYRDHDGKTWAEIEIKSIEDNQKDGKLLPDSAAANSEIAFAMLFNPAIIGASLPSGPYTNSQGGSNVRESVLMQIILHELERQYIRRIMMVPAHFNGWKKKYPGLDFIIPATTLTTLDTGAGSKPVVTGNTKTEPDGTN